MKLSKWSLLLVAALFAGCTPKTNDGITPNQPAYSNAGYPNPLVIYNGNLAPGVVLASPYLPSPYDASLTINYGDTSIKPIAGNANLAVGVTNYSNSNSEYAGAVWAAFGLTPSVSSTIDLSSGNYTTASFYARGTFAAAVSMAPVNINVGGSTTYPVTLTTNWQKFTLALPGNLTAVSQYMVIGVSLPADLPPIIVYIDQFQYQ